MQLGCDCDTSVITVPGPPGRPGPPGDTFGALTITGTALQDLSGHRAVYRRPDGLIDYASSDDPTIENNSVWVTTGAASAGASVTAVIFGEISEPSWNWSQGLVFLGIDGVLTQIPPAAPDSLFLAVVGYALGPTKMFVNRQPSIELVP